MKLYVPSGIDISNVSCVSFLDNDNVFISTYNGSNYQLSYNNLISDYTLKAIENLDVSCYDVDLTHDVYYRKDITNILVSFFILTIVCFYFPYRIFARCFGKWFKI